MALLVVTRNKIGGPSQVELAAGQDLIIAKRVVLETDGGNGIAIVGAYGNASVLVENHASIYGTISGFALGGSGVSNVSLEIRSGATVTGGDRGVGIFGNGFSLTNYGDIQSDNTGVIFSLNGAAHTGSIVNHGNIYAQNTGITAWPIGTSGTLEVINTGTIWAGVNAIYGAPFIAYEITNTGRIIGNLTLSDVADTYDGVSGRLKGVVNANGGDDLIRMGVDKDVVNGGAGADRLYGGTGNDTLNGDTGRDRLYGQAGNDHLNGGSSDDYLSGGDGDDWLVGGSGNDELYGGAGADQLFGGSGADTFVYKSVADSTTTTRDIIGFFDRGEGDKIDLSAIDASTKSTGNQAFKFIGTAAFSKTAGELRYKISAEKTYIYADVDGDGKVDFSVQIDNALALKATDFVL